MADTKKKEYNSLGQMMAKGDFETALEKLNQYEQDKEEMDALNGPAYRGSNFSILDEMLFNLPRYIVKKPEEEDTSGNNLLASLGAGAPIKAPEIVTAELDPNGLLVADKLMALGANPNATVYNGVSAMLIAATVNNPELLKRLIDNPFETMDLDNGKMLNQRGDINTADGRGQDLLFYAAMSNALDNMEFLVTELGLDMDKQYMFEHNKTLMHLLCMHLNEIHTLTPKGYELELDVIPHKEPAIRKLIEMGVNPTIEDDYENIPEMLVPSTNDSPHNIEQIPEDTIKNWDKIYEDVGNYRKYYELNNKKQYKTTF